MANSESKLRVNIEPLRQTSSTFSNKPGQGLLFDECHEGKLLNMASQWYMQIILFKCNGQETSYFYSTFLVS